MGLITGESANSFRSADYIFSKIKREFKSFDAVNILDDTDFPTYTAEVLSDLGVGGLKEDIALLKIENSKACLPTDFKKLHAAYKCGCSGNEINKRHLQNTSYFENDITCSVLQRSKGCEIDCKCQDRIIETITVRSYVNEVCNTYNYNNVSLLRLSPNARKHCIEDCINIHASSANEITINNGSIFTNFDDGDIYIEYYAMALDENNTPMIPDIPAVERAIEWYIKWQILLNYWLVDDLSNAQNKWSKAEQEYEKAMAKCRYLDKLPSFSTMVNSLRTRRSINKVAFFGNR